ncbi:hypothetical protein BD310DRAFT_1040145 [Dichomitus squalens]|uniref:Uncharacterized protein n=1 Tax=Dichomitus squalens TaxID=114155 RepID=A0A4Q9PRL8_9APHY|nr:hypothetical protein BD310DRAFT_1040145 [Dichomitus squalens]
MSQTAQGADGRPQADSTLGAPPDSQPQLLQQQQQQQQQQGPLPPFDETRSQTDRDSDDAMDAASDLFTEREGSSEETVALKRLRTSRATYSVSRTDTINRELSPLRKPPPQSSWDKEPKKGQHPERPEALEDWVRLFGDTKSYNPEFDEARYSGIPTGFHANPNYWLTQIGKEKPALPEGGEAFVTGPLPHIHISDWHHLGNIQDQQSAMVKERGKALLALVPHGGGREMNKAAVKIAQCFQEFLSSLRFEGLGGKGADVIVTPPDPRNAGGIGSKNPFAQPWTFYVDIQNDPADFLRAFLLYQEHFAISPLLSFSVYPLVSDNPQPWKLFVLMSPHLPRLDAAHNKVLAMRDATRNTIIGKLKAHQGYRDLVAKLATCNIGHTGDHEQVFMTVTDTYHLQPVTAETSDGTYPAYIFYARPITTGKKELDSLKSAIREALCGATGDHFYVNMRKIQVIDDAKSGPAAVDCKLCKSETHITAECPLPKARGWRGLNASDLGRDGTTTNSNAGPAREDQGNFMEGVLGAIRGNGMTSSPRGKRGRGNANERGRGRGGSGRGGWYANRT